MQTKPTALTAQARAQAIDDIVAAARTPLDEIVPVYELEYADGSWRAGGHPSPSVRHTGQRRICGYALMSRHSGARYGQREATAEAVRARVEAYQDRQAAEFRARLEASDDARLSAQYAYWLKEEL